MEYATIIIISDYSREELLYIPGTSALISEVGKSVFIGLSHPGGLIIIYDEKPADQ
jgi:hypothetical protein